MTDIPSGEERLQQLLAICYQIAGGATLGPNDEDISEDTELLLNTLSRPDGPGADILLANEGPYQDVMKRAIAAEEIERLLD